MKLKILSFLISTLIASLGYAQVPITSPSLSAGVGGIAFEQGKLNVEALANLLASKKTEVKSALAERLILKKLECGNFATWNYVRKTLETLFGQGDIKTKTKEILKDGTKLVLVYGIGEFYLNYLAVKSRNDDLSNKEKDFLKIYFKWIAKDAKAQVKYFLPKTTNWPTYASITDESRKQKDLTFNDVLISTYLDTYTKEGMPFTSSDYKSVQDDFDSNFNKNKAQLTNDASNPYLPKMFLLPSFSKNKNKFFTEAINNGNKDCRNAGPNHILLDMIYDICLNNKEVHRSGFYLDRGNTEIAYELRNKFLSKANDTTMYPAFDSVRSDIDEMITTMFKHYNGFKHLLEDCGSGDCDIKNVFSSTIDVIHSTPSFNKIRAFDANQLLSIKDEVVTTIDTTFKVDAQIDYNTLCKEILEYLSDSSLKMLKDSKQEMSKKQERALGLLSTIASDRSPSGRQINDYFYYLEKDVVPELLTLNFITEGGVVSKLTTSTRKLKDLLKYKEINALKEDNDSTLINNLSQVAVFIRIVEMLNNLDQVETYDYIFKFLLEIGNTYGDEQVKAILTNIADKVDKYITIDKEENVLNLDIGEMAVDMYKQYGENASGPVSMYFSVGINTGWDFTFENKTNLLDSANFAYFASEKIGVKFKIIDWNKKRAYSEYKFKKNKRAATRNMWTKPIVSDFYGSITFSGLLYQIEQLRSVKGDQFRAPLVNIGFGISFFNGLDLNLNYAMPMRKWEQGKDFGMLTLGFDVKITEYLAELGRKKYKKKNATL